jgi:hypothetical protein
MLDLANNFEFLATLGIFLLAAGMVGYFAWIERRPRKSLMPRMFPSTPMILIFGFIGLLALVHLANLYGIHTGNRPRL